MAEGTIHDVIAGRARWAVVEGEALATLAALPDSSIDAVITDPPYSSGGAFRGDRVSQSTTQKYVLTGTELERPDFAGDTRDSHGYQFWCALWLAECLRVTRAGSPVCLFTDWRQLATTTAALQGGGMVFRGIAVWDKTEAARPTMGRFRSQCEYVVWGSNGPMSLERESVGCLPGVFRHKVNGDDKHHITGKPTPLMRDVVRICEPRGVVLDLFGGSGTTGVAALMEGRRVILCERVPEYADIARRRCAAAEKDVDWRAPPEQGALDFGGAK